MARLTKAQREMLTLATRSETGNPWPLIGIRRRAGGALNRMFDRMKSSGLFDADNIITPAGRAALAEAEGKGGGNG